MVPALEHYRCVTCFFHDHETLNMWYRHFLSYCWSISTSWVDRFPAIKYHENSHHSNQSSIHNFTCIDWGRSNTKFQYIELATQLNRIEVILVAKSVEQHQHLPVTQLSSPPSVPSTNHDSSFLRVTSKSEITSNIENFQRVISPSDVITTTSKILEHSNLSKNQRFNNTSNHKYNLCSWKNTRDEF